MQFVYHSLDPTMNSSESLWTARYLEGHGTSDPKKVAQGGPQKEMRWGWVRWEGDDREPANWKGRSERRQGCRQPDVQMETGLNGTTVVTLVNSLHVAASASLQPSAALHLRFWGRFAWKLGVL